MNENESINKMMMMMMMLLRVMTSAA